MTKRTAQRLDWADRVARWRYGNAKNRHALDWRDTLAAVLPGETRYLFRIRRFVHCIDVRTLSQMDYVAQYSAT